MCDSAHQPGQLHPRALRAIARKPKRTTLGSLLPPHLSDVTHGVAAVTSVKASQATIAETRISNVLLTTRRRSDLQHVHVHMLHAHMYMLHMNVHTCTCTCTCTCAAHAHAHAFFLCNPGHCLLLPSSCFLLPTSSPSLLTWWCQSRGCAGSSRSSTHPSRRSRPRRSTSSARKTSASRTGCPAVSDE